jgi:hypothetical protein
VEFCEVKVEVKRIATLTTPIEDESSLQNLVMNSSEAQIEEAQVKPFIIDSPTHIEEVLNKKVSP